MGTNRFVRGVVVPLATIFTIAANVLINALKLNGFATGQISDNYPNFFVPAGYVFAVWGIIYIALITFAIWQALPAQLGNPRLQDITPTFLLGCAVNVLWLVSFHFLQFGAAIILTIVLLLSLISIYLRLRRDGDVPARERWFAQVPISIYLGWITVATVANDTQLLVAVGWDGFGIAQQTWAAIMIAVAVVVALLMFITRRDVAYLLVLVWAIAGIGVKQAAVPAVSTPAWIATAAVAVMVIASLIVRRPTTLRPRSA